ncbi:class I SAM-dependent methyltransferase [Actinophytocola oryzae]|uniref:Methyltransferase family protein n=1 Tax=Actinophytocola oryzae TaxID=502181 RepID=A0A4R7VF65_9PSEU|nr:class I SAM-dependent methyltransferase [Actinophytocola oryzae]TDV47866.1 methyltransferase family protein [Actinophytocola oryzae]
MPTLEPHQYRRIAESFGTDAQRYDRARPAYPAELIDRIVATSPGGDVLDVGCGTGIAARQLQAAGATVLGLEPDPRMAGVARETGVAVEVSTFEDWDPAGRTFDAVVAAQAWHWVDPVAGAAKVLSTLRPGGLFAAFWHVFMPPAEIQSATATALRRAVPDSPFNLDGVKQDANPYQPLITSTGERLAATGAFGEPRTWRFEVERTSTRDQWLDLMPTLGPLTRVPPERLDPILTDVGAAIDAMGGSFTTRFTTVGVAITRA